MLDETRLDYDSFVTKVAELEPDRTWANDGELRKRFDDLQPENNTIYLQDYRLTLLFEALSRSQAKVIDLFRSIDTDGSATIDKSEFVKLVRDTINFQNAHARALRVFSKHDVDGSGMLSREGPTPRRRARAMRKRCFWIDLGHSDIRYEL